MKNRHFLFLTFVLVFLQLGIVAQQQGFGCITNQEFLSLSGIEKNNSIVKKPIVNMPPIFGTNARKNGKSLPLPFGAGFYSIYYDQGYTASNLRMIPDSSTIVARADSLYQSTTAYEFKTQIRPNLWLFPFLNIYGIFGYAKGVISPNLVVPYIVLENVPVFDTLVIDTAFEIHDDIAYVGPTYGHWCNFFNGF